MVMANTHFAKRLTKESKWLSDCYPLITGFPEENNMFIWHATIQGPPETPYEEGTFNLKIVLSENYPFVPPKIEFLTPIYHPNIFKKTVCVDILQNQWSAMLNISKVLLSIVSLLSDPNPNDSLNNEAGELYVKDLKEFKEKAKRWVQYATKGN